MIRRYLAGWETTITWGDVIAILAGAVLAIVHHGAVMPLVAEMWQP